MKCFMTKRIVGDVVPDLSIRVNPRRPDCLNLVTTLVVPWLLQLTTRSADAFRSNIEEGNPDIHDREKADAVRLAHECRV